MKNEPLTYFLITVLYIFLAIKVLIKLMKLYPITVLTQSKRAEINRLKEVAQ